MAPLQKILIGGNHWEIHKLTPKLEKKYLTELKQDAAHVMLRGFCDGRNKQIFIKPGMHPEDFLQTTLHEGLHAILIEMGLQLNISNEENTVDQLTREVLSFLKQTVMT